MKVGGGRSEVGSIYFTSDFPPPISEFSTSYFSNFLLPTLLSAADNIP